MDLEAALKEFEKKFKDKSGHKWEDRSEPAKKGKYTFIERNYADDEDEAEGQVKKEEGADDEEIESKLPRQTQRLMELIFNQNHFNAVLESIGYNANKLPLGKLSKTTLKQGFEHLKELASLIKHPALAQNKYGLSQEEVSQSDFVCRFFWYSDMHCIPGQHQAWDWNSLRLSWLGSLPEHGFCKVKKIKYARSHDNASSTKEARNINVPQ